MTADQASSNGKTWKHLLQPEPIHPNVKALWQAEESLEKLALLKATEELHPVFLGHIVAYENELRRCADFLRTREHKVAFIGNIGVGKSTAICKMTGLLVEDEPQLTKQVVLETGSGGITICEVEISEGNRFGLRIEPRTVKSIQKDVADYAEYLFRKMHPNDSKGAASGDGANTLGISGEVVRAIRNMTGLLSEKRTNEDGSTTRVNLAEELAQQMSDQIELAEEIFRRMSLDRRVTTELWIPDQEAEFPERWVQNTFSKVNNGRHPDISMPDRIEVTVPYPLSNLENLSLRIIDTKGIDQTAERADLECHFGDDCTIVVLCSSFNDAPSVATQTLLQRANASGVRNLDATTLLLVLPKPGEASVTRWPDGEMVESDEDGYEVKSEQVELLLKDVGIDKLNIGFYNAASENPDKIRKQIVSMIHDLRQCHVEEIARLGEDVNRLIKDQKDEQVRSVYKHVDGTLKTWIDEHRDFQPNDKGVQKELVQAINKIQYPAKIWASVRRNGNYPDLDYYHHLSKGGQHIAVSQIKSRIGELQVLLHNLMKNAANAPAKPFLERVNTRVDVAVEKAAKNVLDSSQRAFRKTLEKDQKFWNRCEGRWGKGSGFRTAISEMTDEQINNSYEAAHQALQSKIAAEWKKLIEMIEEMVEERRSKTAT